ncbi:MAG: glycerol-3-phosphate 1-O-acyltransferase PlsY [Myxococcota bacterium]|nr:glycerol-3-phosphate 1-O-acyltransferase PlsY [Myxococcota bacterium]
MLTALVALFLAYLVGSFPTGLVLAWTWRDIDVRCHGSGNTGATNVGRIAGRRLGRVTLAIDAAKGLLPVVLSTAVFDDTAISGAMVLAAVVGHCWSLFLGFRGGKGVATAAGALLGLAPGPGLVATVSWLIVVRTTRRASAAALVAAAVLPLLCALLSPHATWIALCVALLVGWQHRTNIERLLSGTELTTEPVPRDMAPAAPAQSALSPTSN